MLEYGVGNYVSSYRLSRTQLIHVTTATPPAARPAAAWDSEYSGEYLKSDPAVRSEAELGGQLLYSIVRLTNNCCT
jgi:hypothetical protein